MTSVTVLNGDALDVLRTLPASAVQCCVTSPPYFGLRDYGVEGQIGLEASPDAYIARLVSVFAEVRRVLRDDGTLWLNIGDSYYNRGAIRADGARTVAKQMAGRDAPLPSWRDYAAKGLTRYTSGEHVWGLKEKDRLMIPARVALALQADGWWLRDEIVWHKPRTTPFPANDRTVSAHEMVYLFSKRERYFFDWAAIEEPAKYAGAVRLKGKAFRLQGSAKAAALADMDKTNAYGGKGGEEITVRETRRARSVWSINPQPYKGAHFATMPLTLAEQCVKAGSRVGDPVLDPFGGAGTTAVAAQNLGRMATIIELSPSYCALAKRRLGVPFTIFDHLVAAAESRVAMTKALRA